jgi:Xaa-Pro aminopeptidase
MAPTCTLQSTEGLVERLRIVKDDWELEVLTEAGRRLSDAAKCIMPKALAGMMEREVAAIIEAELRRVGFDKPAFDTIVASGLNSAVPHYRAGDRVLEPGDLVVLDFGGMLHGYAVDLTRTMTVGPPTARQRKLLEDVAAAQDAGFAVIREGTLRPRSIARRASRWRRPASVKRSATAPAMALDWKCTNGPAWHHGGPNCPGSRCCRAWCSRSSRARIFPSGAASGSRMMRR